MKLRSLRIHGFKSFADATVIDFHAGLTAVVGPNGCGKSNISDAIRWVLGEQRPSAIRGGKMEEAIFQGSLNRRPVNRGAVTIVAGRASPFSVDSTVNLTLLDGLVEFDDGTILPILGTADCD